MHSLLNEKIEKSIFIIRNQKVMVDQHLANLYEVTTKQLNQQVRRNCDRFPEDFMFQLNTEEHDNLRSQFVTSKIITEEKRGGRRYLPFVFTEQGVAMLSSVLNSPRAIKVNIEIMRAFVRTRQILSSHKILLQKIESLETRHDKKFKIVFDTLKAMMSPQKSHKRIIGFNR